MCEEKLRLLRVYDQAATLFSDRVNKLSRDVGEASRADYNTMLTSAEKARLSAQSARLALDQHAMTHRLLNES
jgi:hypothetical protein